ncbi:MAG TPA: cell envelope integrity EipB family protein [Xanthobacteraceae bacterium]|jgi:hypothetical protein|nr:cell envelope integrity EipB family protein [Xanthobacteraceae bacterium]
MIRTGSFVLCATALVFSAGQAAAAPPVQLAAHRAIYELSLDPEKSSSRIDSARGRIAYEMRGNACEGYSVNLRQVTELDTGEGSKTTNDLRSATWEDGAAKNFRFKNQNFVNRKLKDDVDGTAVREADGSLQVRLGKTKERPIKFGGPIMLPTEQIYKLIQAGESGKRIIETRVFDGSPDGKKSYDTLAVVGGGKTGNSPDVEEAAKVAPLEKLKRFPVTVSYFEPKDNKDKSEQTPAYTLAFDLYENGVSRGLRLDYGSFALRGELKSIEFFKSPPCKQ